MRRRWLVSLFSRPSIQQVTDTFRAVGPAPRLSNAISVPMRVTRKAGNLTALAYVIADLAKCLTWRATIRLRRAISMAMRQRQQGIVMMTIEDIEVVRRPWRKPSAGCSQGWV